jgi:hypothetical protein
MALGEALPLVVRVYGALDWATRAARERAREAALLLSSYYIVETTVDEVLLPLGEDEAPQHGLPEVWIEYEGGAEKRLVSRGRVPGIDEILDNAFLVLDTILGPVLPGLGLRSQKAEEGLLGV